MDSRYSWESALMGNVGGLVLLLIIVAVIAIVWLIVKAVNLVLRVITQHPDNKLMWLAIGGFILLAALAALTEGRHLALDASAGLSGATLVLTAKGVELYYDQLFQCELSRDGVIHQVLHEPWWSAA